MANFNLSPNMNLPVPTIGVDPGPDYASNLNASLTLIDGHNHASGSGVQITPAGLNINSDLTFLNNNAISLRSVRFQTQGSALVGASDLNCLFGQGVDLWFNDGNGNHVRMTQGGAVAGTPGSISNLVSPASASYNAGLATFVWQSAANTPANLDAGFIILRNNVANAKALTLSPPSSMVSNFSITLPYLPAGVETLNIDASGNMGHISYDGIGQAMTSIGANAILATSTSWPSPATSIANSVANARTRTIGTSVTAGGVAISSSCGTYSTSSGSAVDVTNLSISITTTGRPVFLCLIPDGTASAEIGGLKNNVFQAQVYYLRGVSTIAQFNIESDAQGATNVGPVSMNSLIFIDAVATGTYTYKVQTSTAGGATMNFQNIKLVAYEL